MPELPPCQSKPAQYAVKRALDYALAAGTLAIGAPLLLGLAAAIRLDSPGPALYPQDRVGHRVANQCTHGLGIAQLELLRHGHKLPVRERAFRRDQLCHGAADEAVTAGDEEPPLHGHAFAHALALSSAGYAVVGSAWPRASR